MQETLEIPVFLRILFKDFPPIFPCSSDEIGSNVLTQK